MLCQVLIIGLTIALLVTVLLDVVICWRMQRSIEMWQAEAKRLTLECNKWRELVRRWKDTYEPDETTKGAEHGWREQQTGRGHGRATKGNGG